MTLITCTCSHVVENLKKHNWGLELKVKQAEVIGGQKITKIGNVIFILKTKSITILILSCV